MTRYERVQEILDQAVGGPDVAVGVHGAFWRGVKRDDFIKLKIRTLDLLTVGNGAVSIVAKLHDHTDPVQSVALSGSGKVLASGNADTTAKLWDVATRTVMFTLKHNDFVISVTFRTGGEMLATASFEQAQLWDVKTGNLLITLKHRSGTNVLSVAFSPDGTTVATAGDDNVARLWSPSV